MIKKRFITLILVLIILLLGSATAYSQMSFRIGLGAIVPGVVNIYDDHGSVYDFSLTEPGLLRFAIDLGIYYPFKDGGAFGFELNTNFEHLSLHIAYIFEHIIKMGESGESGFCIGFYASTGFDYINGYNGFGLKTGFQFSFAPPGKYIRIGGRAGISLSYGIKNDMTTEEPYTEFIGQSFVLLIPMTIFFQFGF